MFKGTMLIDTTYYKDLDLFDSLNFYQQSNSYFKSHTITIPISANDPLTNLYADVLEST